MIGQREIWWTPPKGRAMEFMPDDRLPAEIHFATARENLNALVGLVPTRGPDVPPGMVGAAVASAVRALDGVGDAQGPVNTVPA